MLEEDAGREDIYAALRVLNPVPLRAGVWLLLSRLLGLGLICRA